MSTSTGQVSTVAFGLAASTVAGAVAEAVGLPGLPVSLVVAVGVSAVEAVGISRSQPTRAVPPSDPVSATETAPVTVLLPELDGVETTELAPIDAPVPDAQPAAKRKSTTRRKPTVPKPI